MRKDTQVLMWKDLQQLNRFDSCWFWSVLAESTILVSQNLPKVSYKQLCRDMELTLMNESAKHASSLIELHGHLNSSHFMSFGTTESPTLVSVMSDLSDVAAAMATLSTCRSSSMARKDSWTGVEGAIRSTCLHA